MIERRAGQRYGRIVEGDQISDADDGAGQGVIDHGDDLHGLARPVAASARNKIADQHAVEAAERHAQQAQ